VSSEAFSATVHRTWSADLDTATLYALLRLRVQVFVVEQDRRDLEPSTRHYWLGGAGDWLNGSDDPEPVLGCGRLLKEADGSYRVSRLCLSERARGRGLGRRLMDAVLAEVGDGECVADAQRYLVGFYERYGFVAEGDPYDWGGIEHVPMRRVKREHPR
jgi:ElaA protein